MELKIVSSNDNKLMSRKEIRFSVDQDGSTASRDMLTKEICKKLNLNPDFTIIVRIDQGFGKKESTGTAHSYDSKEMLEKYEPKHLLTRIGKKAAKGKKEEAAAAPAAEDKKE